ncbi:MAG: 23S rRNA (guanosine(2251)-2'-O)-methyltransferase RlmB [Clostridia bacterium]|nr:23S rRNA (guanosine(2251)-2'-O)-methyltransferase RlmB [Clostridia bacterium]
MENKKKAFDNKNRRPADRNRHFEKHSGGKDASSRKPREEDNTAAPTEDGIHGDYENGAVIGRNAVRELLKSQRSVDKLLVQKGERTGSIVVLVAQAIEQGIPVIETEKSKLDALAGYAPHQGVIAFAAEKEYCTVEDLLQIAKDRGEAPLLVICDGITDPYNLGAIIRCAECCGAHGLIIPKRRAAGLTPLVTKASAGAIEHLAVAKVANIASTVEWLKEQGVWTFAAEAGGSDLYQTDFRGPCALILGSEGNGVSQLVRKTCDTVVSIPMYGKVNSFNVSTAAAVLLAEIAHQHHKQA